MNNLLYPETKMKQLNDTVTLIEGLILREKTKYRTLLCKLATMDSSSSDYESVKESVDKSKEDVSSMLDMKHKMVYIRNMWTDVCNEKDLFKRVAIITKCKDENPQYF